jgi:hypothetical protein
MWERVLKLYSESKLIQSIGFILVIAIVVALAFAGIGILGALLFLFLVAVSIYFGSIRDLSGSALLATMAKMFSANIKTLASVWFAGPTLDKLFGVVDSFGYFELIITAFFFFFLISFGTGCIRPKLFTITTTVENKKEES